MIPFLTYPLALITALTLPTLAAIYFFRNRFKRRKVGGIFLWQHALRSREGGTVIRRMRSSRLFILELLALAALVLAAADPRIPMRTANRSVVVILDNSASMLAGKTGERPRDKALPAIRKIIRSGKFKSVSFMLAGRQPNLLDIGDSSYGQDSALLQQWSCLETASDLEAAISMAAELSGRQSQLLVITDRKPDAEPENGKLRWQAFGTPVDNIGFVNVRRSSGSGSDRLFLAVGNFSADNISLTIPVGAKGQLIKTIRLKIRKGGSESAIMTLPRDCGAITMQLPPDGLEIDNSATLLPQPARAVGVRVSVDNERLRKDLQAAVAATGLRDRTAPTHLLITDRENSPAASGTWELRILKPDKPVAYRGPFVVDYNHPLAYGLGLDGIIWGASETNSIPGTPIILAGNQPLLSSQTLPSGKQIFRMQFAPELSNLRTTPSWPTLIWNICKLRSDALPGTKRSNLPAGSSISLALPKTAADLTVTHNGKTEKPLQPQANHITLSLPEPGIYTVSGTDFSDTIAANFMAPS